MWQPPTQFHTHTASAAHCQGCPLGLALDDPIDLRREKISRNFRTLAKTGIFFLSIGKSRSYVVYLCRERVSTETDAGGEDGHSLGKGDAQTHLEIEACSR